MKTVTTEASPGHPSPRVLRSVFYSMSKRPRDAECLYVLTCTSYFDYEPRRDDNNNPDVEVIGVYWTKQAAKEAERQAKIDFISDQVMKGIPKDSVALLNNALADREKIAENLDTLFTKFNTRCEHVRYLREFYVHECDLPDE